MTDFFTVRVPDNYTVDGFDLMTVLRYENKDKIVIDNSFFKQFRRSKRMKIKFSDVEEVRQKTAKVSQVITKSGTTLTVNSKNGVRLFKFLNVAEPKPEDW